MAACIIAAAIVDFHGGGTTGAGAFLAIGAVIAVFG